jgi:hypothetical protein
LPQYCFASCEKLKLTEIATDDDRDFVIGPGAFMAAAANVTTLYFGRGVEIADIPDAELGSLAIFANNGYAKLDDLYVYKHAGCCSEEELRRRIIGEQTTYKFNIHSDNN